MTGFNSKRDMANDKDALFQKFEVEQPVQEPSITRPCRSCNGTGDRDTGIAESPIATCKPCNGTGQIALAQPPLPVQEPDCQATGVCVRSGLYVMPLPVQPVQEPVAWVWKDMRGQDIVSLFEPRFNSVPLYTIPPQRPWVGLTDEDIHNTVGYDETRETYQFALALIAKLKERNS